MHDGSKLLSSASRNYLTELLY